MYRIPRSGFIKKMVTVEALKLTLNLSTNLPCNHFSLLYLTHSTLY